MSHDGSVAVTSTTNSNSPAVPTAASTITNGTTDDNATQTVETETQTMFSGNGAGGFHTHIGTTMPPTQIPQPTQHPLKRKLSLAIKFARRSLRFRRNAHNRKDRSSLS